MNYISKYVSHCLGLDGRDGIPGEPGLDGVPGKCQATKNAIMCRLSHTDIEKITHSTQNVSVRVNKQ